MTAPESGCVPAMKPMVMAASLAQSGGLVSAKGGPLKLIQSCPCNPDGRPPLAARRAIDDKLFCAVMCCCNTGASTGIADQRLMQQCVNDVFAAADKDLNWKSRYKSEISYVMDPPSAPGQPAPLMSRTTGIATKPTEYWQGGARAQLGNTWEPGLGMVRRPDIVVVNDPCQPPVGSNIERVVEMKFEGDTSDTEQNEAYRQIAGSASKYSVLRAGGKPQAEEEPPCDCGSDENRRHVPVPTPEAQAEQERKAKMIKTAAGAGAAAAGGMAISEVLEAVLVGLLAAL